MGNGGEGMGDGIKSDGDGMGMGRKEWVMKKKRKMKGRTVDRGRKTLVMGGRYGEVMGMRRGRNGK